MDEVLNRAGPWARILVLHNWPIMLYSVLILWSAILTYLRPSRRSLVLLYGLLILALAFEYQKHGIPVARVTTNYLFETETGWRDALQLILLLVGPVLMYVLGVGFLCLSIFDYARRAWGDSR